MCAVRPRPPELRIGEAEPDAGAQSEDGRVLVFFDEPYPGESHAFGHAEFGHHLRQDGVRGAGLSHAQGQTLQRGKFHGFKERRVVPRTGFAQSDRCGVAQFFGELRRGRLKSLQEVD